jgi:iron complex outermembrane receptor protein
MSIILCLTIGTYGQKISDTIKLSPVEIMDKVLNKVPYIRSTIIRTTLDENAVKDIGEVLRTIPNVSGLRKGGANIDPVVRGFKFSQLITLINGSIGIEGGCPNRMDPTTSHIDIDDIERIEVIKGPFALRYGPSFGGVINLITVQPAGGEKFELHAKAVSGYESVSNGNREHLAISGGIRPVNFVVTGNRLQYGDYKDGKGNTVRSSFTKYSYGARLGFTPFKNHNFVLSYLGSYHQNVRFPALQMDERSDDTRIMGFSYVTKGLKGTFSGANLKASYTDVRHIMDNKYRSNSDTMVAVSDVNATTLGVRGGVDLNFRDQYFLFVGGDFQQINKDGDRVKTMIMQGVYNGMIPTKTEALWNEAMIQNIGLYSEFKTSFGTFDIVAALRADYNSASSGDIVVYGSTTPGGTPPILLSNTNTGSNYTNISFNAGGTKNFGDNISLSLTAGRGVRSPNILERFIILLPVGYDNYDYIGNPQLKPETNNEADLTLKYSHSVAGTVEFNIFYSFVQDFISGRRLAPSVQKPLSMNVLGVKQFYNAGDATFMGFELGYSLPTEHALGASVSVAWTYATISEVTKQILDPTKIISQQVVGEEVVKNDAVSEIPPMEVNAGLSYKFFNGRLIPRVSGRFVLDQPHVSSAYYEKTTPGFIILNAGLTYKYSSLISFNGGINNLLDTYYYEHLNRRMIGSTSKLYEPGRNLFASIIFNL